MDSPPKLPTAQYRRFESAREYEAIIDASIPRTAGFIRVFDRELGRAWNAGDRHDALRRFLLADRANRLLIVVHEASRIDRDCPRMAGLVQQFSHAVKIHETLRIAKSFYDPFVVFDGNHYVHRFHYDHLRAAQGTDDVAGAQVLLDRFEELWEASAAAVSAGTTGL